MTTVIQPAIGQSTASRVAEIALWGVAGVGLAAIVFWMIQGPKENPTRSSMEPKAKRRARPIVKGRSCRFEMVEGPDRTCGGGMIHDPTGRAWPKNSVLCGPFRRERRVDPDEMDPRATHYYGGSYSAHIGIVNKPPRALSSWRYLGEVERIYYTRVGRKYGGVRFVHPFNKGSSLAVIVKGRRRVRLYQYGRFMRLELPRDAMLDSRGFVFP